MATQYNLATPTDPNPENIIEASDKDAKGKLNLSLTNFDNSDIPQIEQGSIVEVSGARFVFNSNETIQGSANDGSVYIYIDGADGSANWTNTEPEWNAEKQGFYHTTNNYRYVAHIEKYTTRYMNKRLLTYESQKKTKISVWVDNLNDSITLYDPVIYNHILDDSKNEYNIATGETVIKTDGVYCITVLGGCSNINIKKNNTFIQNVTDRGKENSCISSCKEGDIITIAYSETLLSWKNTIDTTLLKIVQL